MVRIGFDIGGILSKYPREIMALFRACLASPEMEVHVVTDSAGFESCLNWHLR